MKKTNFTTLSNEIEGGYYEEKPGAGFYIGVVVGVVALIVIILEVSGMVDQFITYLDVWAG